MKIVVPSVGYLIFRGGNITDSDKDTEDPTFLEAKKRGYIIHPVDTISEIILGIHPKYFPLPLPSDLEFEKDGEILHNTIPDPDHAMSISFRCGSTYHLVTSTRKSNEEYYKEKRPILSVLADTCPINRKVVSSTSSSGQVTTTAASKHPSRCSRRQSTESKSNNDRDLKKNTTELSTTSQDTTAITDQLTINITNTSENIKKKPIILSCRQLAAGQIMFLEEVEFTQLVSTDGQRYTIIDNFNIPYGQPKNNNKSLQDDPEIKDNLFLSPAARKIAGANIQQSSQLQKQTQGVVKKWRERFFVVNGNNLDYYAYKPHQKYPQHLQESIPMNKDVTIIDYLPDVFPNHIYVFGQKLSNSDYRYIFDVSTELCKKSWIEQLCIQYDIENIIQEDNDVSSTTTQNTPNEQITNNMNNILLQTNSNDIDIQIGNTQVNINKQGYVDKKGGISHLSWQRRYLQHVGIVLRYYNPKQLRTVKNNGTKEEFRESGIIPLPRAIVEKRGRTFSITPSGAKRTFRFRASTEEECDEWVQSINAFAMLNLMYDSPFMEILRKKYTADEQLVRGQYAGFLRKQGTSRATIWRERFFVLDDINLYYFAKMSDLDPIACLEIQSDTEIKMSEKNPSMFFLTPKKNNREYPQLALNEVQAQIWYNMLQQAINKAKEKVRIHMLSRTRADTAGTTATN